MYCSVSSTTIPEPLSAFLITLDESRARLLRALSSALGKFLRRCSRGRDLTSASTLCRYASVAESAGGGSQVDFGLNGCGSMTGASLKKHFNLFDLLNL